MNLYCHSCKSYRAGGTCVNPKRKGDETGYFSPVSSPFEDMPDAALMEELRRRGWRGTLRLEIEV